MGMVGLGRPPMPDRAPKKPPYGWTTRQASQNMYWSDYYQRQIGLAVVRLQDEGWTSRKIGRLFDVSDSRIGVIAKRERSRLADDVEEADRQAGIDAKWQWRAEHPR